MRRLLLLAPVLLALAGCGVFKPSEEEAVDTARQVATDAGGRLHSQRPRRAEDVGRSASAMDGVEVLRVDGVSTHEGEGLELILRTSASAYDGWFDVEEVTVRRCFAVRVSPEVERGEKARDVNCPDGSPLRFGPSPEVPFPAVQEALPRVPEGGRVDEVEVRRVLAGLDMSPSITTELKTEDGRVGILLSPPADGYAPVDCVLAVVAPGGTNVWVPPRIQRMPGEGGCSVTNALHAAPHPH
ncbi:translation initiation factor IF-2 [Streptomyces althioticus]|uniref:translation initiation factor IF-2 n=1 Tax=Streptomyces althioticus TaxID=83380 RepID=UPI003821D67B